VKLSSKSPSSPASFEEPETGDPGEVLGVCIVGAGSKTPSVVSGIILAIAQLFRERERGRRCLSGYGLWRHVNYEGFQLAQVRKILFK
jgi:hypothetical protein